MVVQAFYGIAEKLNRINPFMCLIAVHHLPLVGAFIGRFECGMKSEGKLKVRLPGGKWVC